MHKKNQPYWPQATPKKEKENYSLTRSVRIIKLVLFTLEKDADLILNSQQVAAI